MYGMFGDFFDFNHDGKLDDFEKVAELATFMSIIDEDDLNDDWEIDDFDDDDDDLF